MDSSALVRPYEASDQEGLEWLYARTPPWGRTYPRPQPVPEDIRRVADVFEHVLVAVEQDRDGEAVVGLTTIGPCDGSGGVPVPGFLGRAARAARLRHVLVAPERWRQGIGRRLVQAAMDWSRANNYESVVLETTSDQRGAVAFYRALGFREIGRSLFREWEIVWFESAL